MKTKKTCWTIRFLGRIYHLSLQDVPKILLFLENSAAIFIYLIPFNFRPPLISGRGWPKIKGAQKSQLFGWPKIEGSENFLYPHNAYTALDLSSYSRIIIKSMKNSLITYLVTRHSARQRHTKSLMYLSGVSKFLCL